MNQRLLQKYGKGEARALERLVLEKRFSLTQTDILLGRAESLSAGQKAELDGILSRVSDGEPVQYVLGVADFFGREFLVTPSVLIPRPETAELVEDLARTVTGKRVLDLCTGSGCIAISLALAGGKVTATDISPEVIEVAEKNASRLGADVKFLVQDILAGGPDGEYDVIVSNPPYICQEEAADMEENVLEHEPHLALFVPDSEPLLFYEAIARYAVSHLSDGGILAFEINRRYGHEVARLLNDLGYKNIDIRNDQFDNPRFVFAEAPATLCNGRTL